MKLSDICLIAFVPALLKRTQTTAKQFSKSGITSLFFLKLSSLACVSFSFVILLSKDHLLQTQFSYVIKIRTTLHLASAILDFWSNKNSEIEKNSSQKK